MSSVERDAERRAARLGPEAIARTTFPTSFRGYDADAVRVFLENVANELRDARDREAALRTELEALEARLAEASHLDEDRLTAALGEETARVLTVAREAAADIKSKASDSAAEMLREAQEHASSLRTEADALMARRTEEVEAEAARIRSEAEAGVEALHAEAERGLEAARGDADRIRAEAEEAGAAELEAAKGRLRDMVEEATLVRTRVLEDLARKRKASRLQLERLEAGRARLLDSYAIVQRTLDEANEELRTSLTSAKIAADAAARRVEAEPLATPSELEREVEAAREAMARDAAANDEDVEVVGVVEVVEVVEVTQAVGADHEDNDEPSVDVDELFARIRASREAEVAKAQEVLAAGGAAPDEAADADAVVAEAAAQAESETDEEFEVETAVDGADQGQGVPSADSGEPATEEASATSDDQALLERRDGITDAAEKQAVRKLKRVLADEQNEVLDRLRRNPKSGLGDLFPEPGEHAERYASAVRSDLDQAAQRGGAFYGTEAAKTDVGDVAVELGQALTLPLRDRIEGSLREAAGDDDAMADGVRAVYRDWKTNRVSNQARDAVFTAFNRGLFHSIEPDSEIRWLVDNGGSPCPDAEDNSLAGLVVRGESFPTGHCYPPAHPGCRCLLVPAPH
jgi:DivIVA domain-containing protein